MNEVKAYVDYEGVSGGVPRQVHGNIELETVDDADFAFIGVEDGDRLFLIPKRRIIEITVLKSENEEGIS